jgi:hypothetical protein
MMERDGSEGQKSAQRVVEQHKKRIGMGLKVPISKVVRVNRGLRVKLKQDRQSTVGIT